MWQWLFRGTSSAESGTLFQLRNLIFRRNILKDVMKHMNAVEDFFWNSCHLLHCAAAMLFLQWSLQVMCHMQMLSLRGLPPSQCPSVQDPFETKVLQLVDRYVLLSCLSALTKQHKYGDSSKQSATSRKRPMEHKDDPHLQRIAADHCYGSQRLEPPKKKRRLPEYIAKHSDIPHVSVDQQQQAPDGVLNYSSAVLNDGLLMLELRDDIREGDGPRIIRCWWSTLSMQSMSTMQRRHFKCWPTCMLLEHLDLYIKSYGEELLIHIEDWATTYHWTFTWNTWPRN